MERSCVGADGLPQSLFQCNCFDGYTFVEFGIWILIFQCLVWETLQEVVLRKSAIHFMPTTVGDTWFIDFLSIDTYHPNHQKLYFTLLFCTEKYRFLHDLERKVSKVSLGKAQHCFLSNSIAMKMACCQILHLRAFSIYFNSFIFLMLLGSGSQPQKLGLEVYSTLVLWWCLDRLHLCIQCSNHKENKNGSL